ncbi:MAG: hypothetical protein PWP23_303 [Candidatus Sumerlaeota bacterium]|nr:hypothetical protein [Candidatus Sumerlaeota bacterium]
MPEETLTPFSTAVFINDISQKGAKVCCPAPADHWPRKIKIGMRARLTVHDGQSKFHLICTVAWTAPCREIVDQFCYAFGLSFDLDDAATRDGITRLIDHSQRTPASLQRRTCPVCT